ncbi:MAG: zinc ribbon domain-containing protein [Acidimicrobiales bacterium]
MTEPFGRLLEIQEHDTQVDQLRHRRATLPERNELATLERRRAELNGARSAVGAERDGHGRRQTELETQIEQSKARRSGIEQRMRQSGAAARDLQAMDEEVRHLIGHTNDLEDREIEVMELLEPLDERLGLLDAELDANAARAAELLEAIAAAEAELDEKITAELAARAPLASDVPPDLLARYEALRTKLGGTGAARLVGGSCGGCHLALPAMEVDRIKKAPADAVMTCDNCGRILVR